MKETVFLLKALGETNRLRAFSALLRHGELCLCEIGELLEIAPSTASRHMSLLVEARGVTCEKRGKWVYYRLSPELDPRFLQWLQDSLSGDPSMERDSAKIQVLLEDHTCNCPSREERGSVKSDTAKEC